MSLHEWLKFLGFTLFNESSGTDGRPNRRYTFQSPGGVITVHFRGDSPAEVDVEPIVDPDGPTPAAVRFPGCHDLTGLMTLMGLLGHSFLPQLPHPLAELRLTLPA